MLDTETARRSHRHAAISLTVGALLLWLNGAAAQTALYPYVDRNCGVETTYTASPRHAVTLSGNATELMIALGLQDRIAGTSYMAALRISPQYKAAYDKIPILSPLVATTEQLIDAKADFVYAGYPDGFSTSLHTRDQLQALGMKTRLNTEGCNLGPVTFNTLYEEIRSVARIFGIPERGEALIVSISDRLAAVQKALARTRPVRVLIYNGGEAAPAAALGNTMLNEIVRQAGGVNIFADVANRYGNVSWEQIAAREPQYIVVYYSGTDAGRIVQDPATKLGQARIAILNANPTIRGVPAVREHKFVLLDSVWGQPGPSNMNAVEKLARAFHPEAFRP
jgi:iron complex transport system substrate-binding protein